MVHTLLCCLCEHVAFVGVLVARQLHVSKEVTILGVGLLLVRLGLSLLIVSPMSELYRCSGV